MSDLSTDIKTLFIEKMPPAEREATYELAEWIRQAVAKAGPMVGIHAVMLVKAELEEVVYRARRIAESVKGKA